MRDDEHAKKISQESRLGDLNPRPTHYEFLPTFAGWVTMPHYVWDASQGVIMVTHPISE